MTKKQLAAQSPEFQQLAADYKRLVSTANKRLQRLEKYAERPEYGPQILEYAYRVAQREIRIQRGPGDHKRYSAQIPNTLKALRREINRVERFMELPSSSLPGIRDVYQKRADSLNKLMASKGYEGPKFTWQQYAKFFESGLYQKVREQYDSAVAMKVMAQFIRRSDEIKKYLTETDKFKSSYEIGDKPPVNPMNKRRGRYDARVREIMKQYPEELWDFYESLGK